MKHLLKKIALIIPIVAIVAAFVMPGISQADVSVKNITITKPVITTRTATSVTLESTLTYVTSNPSYNKQFKVANKDINFLYRKNNGSENKVPLTASNAKTIYYDTPIKISSTLTNMDPNATYQGSFSEDTTTPDTKSTAINFWVDTVSFSDGSVEIIPSVDEPGAFDVYPKISVIFKNSSLPANTQVKNLAIFDNLYNDKNVLEVEEPYPFDAGDDFKYNVKYDLRWSSPWTVGANATYKFIFTEKTRNALSRAFNFTTPALPAGTSTSTSTASSSTAGTSSTSTPSVYTVTIGDPKFTRAINGTTGDAEFEVPLMYKILPVTNKGAVQEKLTGVIYNKQTGKKIEFDFPLANEGVTYNTQSTFRHAWSELTKGNEYAIYYYDKQKGTKSTYVSLVYRADGTFAANKITSLPAWTSGTTTADQNPAVGTVQTSSNTSSNGITTTFTASPVYVTNYSNGMDAVKVNGFVKYTNPNKTISLATAQAGTILVNLLDKNGYIKYVDEIDLGTYDTVYDKEIPLNSTMLAVGNSLDPAVDPQPIFKITDAPFTVKMVETKLNARSNAFSVAMPGGTKSPTPDNSSSAQQSSAIAANGTKVTFKVTSADLTRKTGSDGKETTTGVINGHILYDKVVNNDAKINKIIAEVYDSGNPPKRVATGNLSQEAVTSYDIEFSGTFPRLDSTNGLFTFRIKDNDLGVSSQEFTFDVSGGGGMILQNGGYSADDAKTGTLTDGTKVSFGDITLKEHDTSSATFEAAVTYTNTTKNGQAVTGSTIKYVLLNADGSVNNQNAVPVTAKYGQPATVSIKVPRLDATKKYAFQFVEGSSQAQTGKFAFQLNTIDQDLANQNSDNSDSPAAANAGARVKLGNPTPFDSIPEIVTALVDNVVIPIAVPFLALAIIYTGFLFVRARGNPGKIDEAKKALWWTLAGGALILGAYVISLALQGTINDIMGM